MIKFRQKEYSGRGIKIIRGIKKALNRADTAITNGSLSLQDKLLGRKKLIPRSVKVSPKSDIQINRETIKTVRGVQNVGRKVLETPINEGIDHGIRYASGNPLTAAVSVTPFPTFLGVAGEKALKSKLPLYKKITNKFQEGYTNSGISRGIKKFRLPSLSELPHNIVLP